MTKGSGIKYFIEQAGISNLLKVFYTFESGDNTIESLAFENNQYSGKINGDTGIFWSVPGSGFFSGTSISINQTGLNSNYFTNLISFELTNTGKQLLLTTLNNGSGYEIGLNDAHKLYFMSQNNGVNTYATLNRNLSSKNLIYIGYITNYLELGYYNFNSKKFESNSFNFPFGQIKNDQNFVIGSGFTGYLDYFLNFDLLISSDTLNSVASGWFSIPTGESYEIEQICTTSITGYELIPYFNTGIINISGEITQSNGVQDFIDSFPSQTEVALTTGIVESGYIQSGLYNTTCINITGKKIKEYEVLTGYASSFGMDKVIITDYIDNQDIIKIETDYTVFNDIYNKKTSMINSGAYLNKIINTGLDMFYLNGVALHTGVLGFGEFAFNSLFSDTDSVIYDSKSGNKSFTTNITGFANISFTGQQIFINGQNAISGIDFKSEGTGIRLIGNNTLFTGIIFERPIALNYITGNKTYYSGEKFPKNSTLVYLNGIRKTEKYIEGSNYDLLKKNTYNQYNNIMIYEANGDYWD